MLLLKDRLGSVASLVQIEERKLRPERELDVPFYTWVFHSALSQQQMSSSVNASFANDGHGNGSSM